MNDMVERIGDRVKKMNSTDMIEKNENTTLWT